MAGDEFNIVEGPALQQLQTLGWEYMDGTLLSPEASDERDSLKDVVLQKRFRGYRCFCRPSACFRSN